MNNNKPCAGGYPAVTTSVTTVRPHRAANRRYPTPQKTSPDTKKIKIDHFFSFGSFDRFHGRAANGGASEIFVRYTDFGLNTADFGPVNNINNSSTRQQ